MSLSAHGHVHVQVDVATDALMVLSSIASHPDTRSCMLAHATAVMHAAGVYTGEPGVAQAALR